MAIEVETKDTTALSDAELVEMADMCADGPAHFDIGLLSKQREEWVLITRARVSGKLKGYAFCTLERIGGTPSVLIGMGSVARTSRRDSVMRAIVNDQLRRSVLAFPDEDVLVATRLPSPDGTEAFKKLQDVVPRPDHRPTGEERAWGRRLAKRMSIEGKYDDKRFIATGIGNTAPVFDYESAKPEELDADVVALFDGMDRDRGDCLVTCGWAMAEMLAKLAD